MFIPHKVTVLITQKLINALQCGLLTGFCIMGTLVLIGLNEGICSRKALNYILDVFTKAINEKDD